MAELRRKLDHASELFKIILHIREYWQAWTLISFIVCSIAWGFNAIKSVSIIPLLEARMIIVETKMNSIDEIQKDVRQIRDVLLSRK